MKKLLIYFIALAGLQFFQFSFLGSGGAKLLQVIGLGLIIAFLAVHIVYDQKNEIKLNFGFPIILMLLSIIPSMIVAKVLYNQSYSMTLWMQRDVYFYLFYFLLHYLKPTYKDIEQLVIRIALVYFALYFMQMVVFPMKILDVKVITDRNTLRIYMQGTEYVVIAYFISLHLYFTTKKTKYTIIPAIALIISILMGGRQLIAMLAFITILYVLFSRKVKSKIGVFVFAIVALIPFFFIFENIFLGLLQVSETTRMEGAENMRVRAFIFYFQNYFKNFWCYIFGNGIPNLNSPYGQSFAYIRDDYNLVDLGMIGLYFYYGVFFILGALSTLVIAFRKKVEPRLYYWRYYLIQVVLALVTGAGFGFSGFIISYCFVLYSIDISSSRLSLVHDRNKL